MINKVDQQLQNFTEMHDQFIIDWNEAMISGDTSSLEVMTEAYYVAFFNDAAEKPTIFSRTDAITGMRESVNQLLGAQKKFENRVIRLKNAEQAAVFYELIIEKDGNVLARLFAIENWQFIDSKWLLVSEIEEYINGG